jgi:hypothetical protein
MMIRRGFIGNELMDSQIKIPAELMKILVLIILLFLASVVSLAQEIDWYSIDSGGGQSSGNNIELLGIMGQTDSHQMVAGEINLSGGYLPLPDTRDVIFKDSFE